MSLLSRLLVACALLVIPSISFAQPPSPAATAAFNSRIASVESNLARQHQSPETFLASLNPQTEARLHTGDLIIEQLTSPSSAAVPGALLHEWRGTAFIPGATIAGFDLLMHNFPAYPQYFSPQVLQSKILSHSGDDFQVRMRIRQHHVFTVVLDTTYSITFVHLDPLHGYSLSRSAQISEIDSPGTSSEHSLTPARSHGYLWRLNTYWSYEQRDGGLYVQIESISLTRSIPTGLAWAVSPYVESIPRESLAFTLRSACNALGQQPQRRLP